jgi:hypothetical protein
MFNEWRLDLADTWEVPVENGGGAFPVIIEWLK